MARTDLDNAVDELYSAPREDFTSLRKQLAKSARTSGDPDAAAEIEKLAKPTTAAWLANQLARTDSADVAALAELGEALREAHERLDGAELKSLSQQRTELIRVLVRAAARGGHSLSEGVTRELEEIFTAVVADENAARALVAGRLTSAKGFATTSGWPSMPAGDPPPARAKPPARAATKPRSERREGETAEQAQRAKRPERAQSDLEEARAAVKEAEAARAEDERALDDAESVVSEAAAEVGRLTEELDAAEGREKRARGQASLARRAVKEAERRAGHAWRQVQQAERKLSELKDK